MGIVLIAASQVDKLHWEILGYQGKPKLSLTGLVDPATSRIAHCLGKLVGLLQNWRACSPQWQLLQWLGLTSLEDAEAMYFARMQLVGISAGVFLHAERRFAEFPYRLQHIVSPSVTEEEKMAVLRDFHRAQSCCLGPFCTQLKKCFPSIASMQSAHFRKVVVAFEAMCKFTTMHVECEHKVIKDDVCSTGDGTTLATACWRSVCKHLNAAHLRRGGQDTSMPLKRRRVQSLGTGPTMDLLPLCGPHAAGEGAAAGEATSGADNRGVSAADVCGGNPLVCYINYKVKSHVANSGHGRAANRSDITRLRRTAAAEYRASDDIRARWTRLYKLREEVRKQKRIGIDLPLPIENGTAARSGEAPGGQVVALPVWQETFQIPIDDGAPAAPTAPIADAIVQEVRSNDAPSTKAMEKLIFDDDRFRTSPPARSLQPQSKLWGCGCQLKNVCRRYLSLNNCLARFETMQTALNKVVDGIGKPEVSRVRCAYLFLDAASKRACWCLLAKAVYSPKIQIWITCLPPGMVVDQHGFGTEVAPPYDLVMQCRPSRLCTPSTQGRLPWTLSHITSEELLSRMAVSGGEWAIARLACDIKVGVGSLLEMQVSGHGDFHDLKATARDSGMANWLRFMRMPEGNPRDHARRHDDTPSAPRGDGSDGDAPPPLPPPAEGPDHAAAAESEMLEVLLGELGADVCELGWMEEELQTIMEGDVEVGEEAPEEQPEDLPCAAEGLPSEAAEDPEDDASVVMPGISIDAVVPEFDRGWQVPEGSEVGEDGLVLTASGYVHSPQPPHKYAEPLGLVAFSHDKKRVFASCRLHPHCDIKCGIVWEDVPRMRLAQWLQLGTPSKGLATAERQRLGKAHRAMWSRSGPLSAAASSGSGG